MTGSWGYPGLYLAGYWPRPDLLRRLLRTLPSRQSHLGRVRARREPCPCRRSGFRGAFRHYRLLRNSDGGGVLRLRRQGGAAASYRRARVADDGAAARRDVVLAVRRTATASRSKGIQTGPAGESRRGRSRCVGPNRPHRCLRLLRRRQIRRQLLPLRRRRLGATARHWARRLHRRQAHHYVSMTPGLLLLCNGTSCPGGLPSGSIDAARVSHSP